MATDKKPISAYVDEKTKKKATIIAKKEGRTLSNYFGFIISKIVQDYEQEHGEIMIKENDDTNQSSS